ncbi:NAD(P)-dependent oxidoreductase [Streptomyces sp. BH-SS-21]|uniref:NAD(P)-dependent oxidoreductase n=1 Tax=Streptomyces liliiviolaceus TaxID=2823109 RepID=A0A940XXV3_9ACTN|nr:NAD(P)-dependent oxidoreductase [Streptomyces liliiviolaceus]MBQ0851855.1 NAD(P)-dependent oxidoreductase [Streptomyces liliiviolaceus]
MTGALPTVAVVGIGRISRPMVVRLRRAGHAVVVTNRTRERALDVADETGARVAGCPREAAESADIVIVSLADDTAVREVYHGPDGLLAGLSPGVTVLETSTIAPSTVTSLVPRVLERGAVLLDTPVSGSVELAARGELTVLAGGSRTALDQVRPVIDVLATRVLHFGDSGRGSVMKLVVNSLLLSLGTALAESLVLAERAGIDREAAYDAFTRSAAAAPFVLYNKDNFVTPRDAPIHMTLALVAKDLTLVNALASSVGAPMAQLEASRALIDRALAAGLGEHDGSVLAEFLRGSR